MLTKLYLVYSPILDIIINFVLICHVISCIKNICIPAIYQATTLD